MRNTTTIQSGYHLIFRHLFSVCLACLSVLLICMLAHAAGINTDGSLGPATTLTPGGPKGNDYTIPSNLGQQKSSNLFHSFGNFNVDTGYTATFTGPDGTTNVIGRVTGGNSSWIDGRLGCDITGTNLWLLNPFGILFGPNASLNVNGSFHASTADYLQLSDGGVFYTDPSKTSKLTIAAPSAFGFLSSKPESIKIEGSSLIGAESISIIGGDIRIEDGFLFAWDRVNLASLGSPGTVEIVSDGLKVEASNGLGNINISNSAIKVNDGVYIYCKQFSLDHSDITSGSYSNIRLMAEERASLDNHSEIYTDGDIDIQTGYLALTNFGLISSRDGTIYAKNIRIDRSGIVYIPDDAGSSLNIDTEFLTLSNGGQISAATSGTYDGGNVTIKAKDISIDGGFENSNGIHPSNITCQTSSIGNAGSLNIDTESLTLSNGGYITAHTSGSGNGGNVTIKAKDISIDGGFENSNGIHPSNITCQTSSIGNAGSLNIDTESLTLSNGGYITAHTSGSGNGGNVTIKAKDISIDGGFESSNGIFTSVITCQTESTGNAGSLNIDTESLTLSNGGWIGSPTFGSGKGGDVTIKARDVLIDGGFEISNGIFYSMISCQTTTGSTGNAGSVNIDTESLTLSKGGQISASTYGIGNAGDVTIKAMKVSIDGGFESSNGLYHSMIHCMAGSDSSGKAGNISLQADTLSMSNGGEISVTNYGEKAGGSIGINVANLTMNPGAVISSASTGTGDAGNIIIAANDSMLLNDAAITVEASKASAGDIKIQTPNLDMTNTSQITASVSGGSGSGGHIDLNVDTLSITEGSRIESNTAGSGSGGNITVAAVTSVTISGKTEEASGMYSTSTGAGSAGSITVKTPTLNISDSGEISSSASGTGPGGSIDINVANLTMNSGAVISSASTGTGDAGNINLTIADKLESRNSTITTESTQADGGDITITNTGFLTYLINSSITATVGGGPQTTGGNIRINSPYIVLKDSHVIANAHEGKGGNIDITADTYLADWTSTVSASSALGISGQVDINSPLVNLSGLLSPLPTTFADITELLADDCETRYKYRKVSSLVVRGRDALPAQPGDLWPSPVMMR